MNNARKLGPIRGPNYVAQLLLGRLLFRPNIHAEAFGLQGTDRNEHLADLSIDSENRTIGHTYVATPSPIFMTFVNSLPNGLDEYAFVDFGSGKGKVLLLAAEQAFREIIGVEFASELHEFAVRNVAEASKATSSCERIRCVHGDACDLQIPDGKCVLYFNNPFAEPVMERVLDNIESSYLQNPRKIYVLYQQLLPELEDDPTENLEMLDAAHFLTRAEVRFPSLAVRFRLASFALRIYETADPEDA